MPAMQCAHYRERLASSHTGGPNLNPKPLRNAGHRRRSLKCHWCLMQRTQPELGRHSCHNVVVTLWLLWLLLRLLLRLQCCCRDTVVVLPSPFPLSLVHVVVAADVVIVVA